MSLDETCLSNGKAWTFLTNKDGHGGKGTLAAALPGTRSDETISILINAMGKSVRRRVKEVACDLSPSMMLIAGEVFYNAYVVNDRFHVQRVYNEAVDEKRVDIRRQLIAEENNCDRAQSPATYSNGETMRQQSSTTFADVRPMRQPRLSTQRSKSLELKCEGSETVIFLSFGLPKYTLDFNNNDFSI